MNSEILITCVLILTVLTLDLCLTADDVPYQPTKYCQPIPP
jgi:hypothetical protein